MGIAVVGETPSLTGEFSGETHGVLDHTQAHPPGNPQQKGPIYLWEVGEVTESQARAEQANCPLSDSSPTYRATMQQHGLSLPSEYLRLRPLL